MQIVQIVIYIAIIILIIAAIKTVIPNDSASKPCLLGYKAACSFTPISTVILIAAGIVVFLVSKYLLTG